GEVTERPKVRHWKCRVGQKLTAGSNPALSAFPPRVRSGRRDHRRDLVGVGVPRQGHRLFEHSFRTLYASSRGRRGCATARAPHSGLNLATISVSREWVWIASSIFPSLPCRPRRVAAAAAVAENEDTMPPSLWAASRSREVSRSRRASLTSARRPGTKVWKC